MENENNKEKSKFELGYCQKCGQKSSIICRCEVSRFRDSDGGQGDDSWLEDCED